MALQLLSRATDQFMIEIARHLRTMEETYATVSQNNGARRLISVLLTSGMIAPTLTKAARVAALRRRWANATRHLRWHEANELWAELMTEWLKPTAINQSYWNA